MKQLDLLGFASLLWRRKLSLLIPTIAGVAGAGVLLFVLPPLYQAKTMIMVEEQKVAAAYVKPTISTSPRERLRTIEQQVTSRSNLERIVHELQLYPDLMQKLPMELVVARARRDMTVRVQRERVFQISFVATDPQLAAAAANRIAELFIQENLRLREGQAKNTSAFLESELEEMKRQLEEQESKVSSFRIRNEGQLPEQRDVILRAIAQLEAKLQINRERLDQAQLTKRLVQTTSAPLSQASPVKAPSRIRELRLQLVELRSRFTARHPDVIRLEREIAALEKQLGDAPAAEPEEQTQVSPAVQAELETLDVESERLEDERERILADMSRYQARLERIPRVELQLLALTRDYDNLESAYQALLSKRLEARLAENLERSQQSEQFNILERALPPSRPYFPSTTLFLATGLAVGMILGLGLALLREQINQTFADSAELQDAFPGVPIMASIPLIREGVQGGTGPDQPGKRRTA